MADGGKRAGAGADLQRGRVGKAALFLGFMKIGLCGFGGIAPWARRVIVEERGWVDDAEYAALLGMGQVLPGPNTMNAAVILGDRFQGPLGALLCLAGLMAMPLAILMGLVALYGAFVAIPAVEAAVGGAAASAAGLIAGTAIKMMRNVRGTWTVWAFATAVFAAVGLLRLPLVPVVLVAAPLSVLAEAVRRRPA